MERSPEDLELLARLAAAAPRSELDEVRAALCPLLDEWDSDRVTFGSTPGTVAVRDMTLAERERVEAWWLERGMPHIRIE